MEQSFEEFLECGWKNDVLKRYQTGFGAHGQSIPVLFRRKVAALHPEWTEKDLLSRISEDPLLQLALTPEPKMSDLFARMQQRYIHTKAGMSLVRLPREGRGSVHIESDGNLLIGWRDYCSTRPLDYQANVPGSPPLYIYVHDSRLHGEDLRTRDLMKFLSCAEVAQRKNPNVNRFVALVEDRGMIAQVQEEGLIGGAWVGTTDDFVAIHLPGLSENLRHDTV